MPRNFVGSEKGSAQRRTIFRKARAKDQCLISAIFTYNLQVISIEIHFLLNIFLVTLFFRGKHVFLVVNLVMS